MHHVSTVLPVDKNLWNFLLNFIHRKFSTGVQNYVEKQIICCINTDRHGLS